MQVFQHVETPLRIFSGTDCLTHLNRELGRLGASRAVIFTGHTLSHGPLIPLVRDGMGDRCAGVFAGVKAHTPRTGVAEAAAELRRFDADAIVAVGGGSAVVTARAAAIYLAEGDDLDAMCTARDVATGRMHSPRLNADKIPIVIVPTTPNTAIVKAGSAVFDVEAGQRKALFDPKTRAASVFLQPDLLGSSPAALCISSSFDTLALAIEGLMSRSGGDAMSDASLMHSLRLLASGLEAMASADTPESRHELTMSALLCGRGTDHTGAGAATVLGHAIGANHDVENGTAKAVVMPHVLRYNAAHAVEGLRKAAVALDVHSAGASTEALIEAINTRSAGIFSALGVPDRLRDLEIPHDALLAIAERGMTDWFLTGNPRSITEPQGLLDILEAAW